MSATGRYLYAVIDEPAERTFGPIGLDGGAVYTIPEGLVSAVVSDVPNKKVRPERRKLAAHHHVLKALMSERTVLPMAFGLIADGTDAVRAILARNREAFAAQLDRFRGHVEMGLKVNWNVPNIFEYFVNTTPDLRAARDRVFGAGGDPRPEAKMDVGREFERAVFGRREQAAEFVLDALRLACTEIKPEDPKAESEVLNFACLVRADGSAAYDAAVEAAAARFGDEYTFAVSGPWPAHSFVAASIDI